MASSRLCRKGLREQFVVKSDGAEYVRCSNRACGYFRALDELTLYERVVQLDVARAFRGGDTPLCQHQRTCALRVSRSDKNAGRAYFTGRERWPCTFFCWEDLEVTLRPLPSKQTLWRSRPPPFFLEGVCSLWELYVFIEKDRCVCCCFYNITL